MEKEFVPYELAVKLKELGFDEPCLGFYNHQGELILMAQEDESSIEMYKNSYVEMGMQYAAPLFQQVFRWFREKYDLQYNIVWNRFYDKTPYQYEVRPTWRNELLRPYGTSGMCSTYEEAELACLEKLIEIVELK
jgi:hypothetical protein